MPVNPFASTINIRATNSDGTIYHFRNALITDSNSEVTSAGSVRQELNVVANNLIIEERPRPNLRITEGYINPEIWGAEIRRRAESEIPDPNPRCYGEQTLRRSYLMDGDEEDDTQKEDNPLLRRRK